MRSNLHRLAALLHLLSTAALWVAGVGLVAMTAATAWQVFGRYVLNSSPSWTEPVSLILMGWFIFLGAAAGVREDTHLGFDVLVTVVPAKVAVAMRFLSDLAVIVFGAGMAYFGALLAAGTWSATIPVLRLPGTVEYVSIVLGGVLIALFGLEKLVRRLAGMAPAHVPVDEARAEEAVWNS
ncbi:MAG TPA: TRAP transporter small permease [Geminicoccus sp.]|uniref:TRAP transporter small permease n=1 Tax=Geminicoccus sp. TaxID=2024832 RepID=UPI002E313434|nr:TRAP transporter small permease [Geminicoccus sp.]HEX2525063.1 TRAP transporter small permease [Geminicoccus sp.]